MSNTELRQANLSRASLRRANLSGANLRWADLSGADLSGADLSGAKLSGANLTGANLTNATLLGTTLVHVDLTRANLIGVDWAGADLSGATLTGAKLYSVPRFGIKTEGIICDWVDLSTNGDQSNIYRFTPDDHRTFFRETCPMVRLVVDASLDQDAHYALAVTYRQIVQSMRTAFKPPNIQVSRHRTTLTFELESDEQLFFVSYIGVLPFRDAPCIQESTIALVQMIQSDEVVNHFSHFEHFQRLNTALDRVLKKLHGLKLSKSALTTLGKIRFFQSSTKTTLINSSNQPLGLHTHPMFGKRLAESSDPIAPLANQPQTTPSLTTLIDFIQGFHY